MITKEMIADGIKKGVIGFTIDPILEFGTVCKIGDNWFYFGGMETKKMNPAEYLSTVSTEDIIQEIFVSLDKYVKKVFKNEYKYYETVLSSLRNINQ